jgi:hypothetical protein
MGAGRSSQVAQRRVLSNDVTEASSYWPDFTSLLVDGRPPACQSKAPRGSVCFGRHRTAPSRGIYLGGSYRDGLGSALDCTPRAERIAVADPDD